MSSPSPSENWIGMVRSSRPSAIFLPLARHGDRAALAHAAAVVGEIDDELRLALRQRLLRRERGALDAQEVVDERRLAVAQVEAVAALEAAVGDDHALGLAVRHFDVAP